MWEGKRGELENVRSRMGGWKKNGGSRECCIDGEGRWQASSLLDWSLFIQYRPKVMQQFKNCTKINTVKTKWLDIIIIRLKYVQKLVILVFEWVSLVLVNRYIINKIVAKQNDSVAM